MRLLPKVRKKEEPPSPWHYTKVYCPLCGRGIFVAAKSPAVPETMAAACLIHAISPDPEFSKQYPDMAKRILDWTAEEKVRMKRMAGELV